MRRKVIKHGPSTLIISIPSNWAKTNNIAKGSELDVVEDGKRLVVNADNADGQKPLEVDIDITGLDRTSIIYAIRSVYRLGYDTVNVRFDEPVTQYYSTGEKLNVISVIHLEINRLIGFEIIEEKEKLCIIKDMETVSMRDFDNVQRRIFLLILDTFHDFVEGAKTLNLSLLGTIEEKHDTITKFVSYCLRLLNKKGHYVPMKTAYQYHIIAMLDKIADILKYSARDVRKYNKRLSPKVVKVLEAVGDHMRMYYEFFYKYDKAKIVEMAKSRYAIEGMTQDSRLLCNVCIAIAQSGKVPRVQEHAGKAPGYIVTSELFLAAYFSYITEIVQSTIEARMALEYATGP